MTTRLENGPPAPYVGLRPFEFHETALFYGRGEHIAEMVHTLRKGHFLAVIGSSGSGKSSLVRAGLLPAIEAGFMNRDQETCDWRFVVARPGLDPYENLLGELLPKLALGQSLDVGVVNFRRQTLRGGPRGLVEVVADSLLPESTRLVVVIDQFEEIFRFLERGPTQARDGIPTAEQRNSALAFVDLLLATGAERDMRLYIVMTMRSEHLGDCEAFLGLSAAVARSQFLTPRMTREQIQDIIERPLASVGGRIEPQVVTELLNALGTAQDQLPRVEHILLRMWDRACEAQKNGAESDQPICLTLADYRAVGRFESALDQHAEQLYAALGLGADVDGPSQKQLVAERLFRSLAVRTPQGTFVRRLSTVGEVASIAGASEQIISEVVDHFRQPGCNFLIATPSKPLNGETTLDISHESLMRQWGRMRGWVTAEAAAAAELQRLVRDAHSWNEKMRGLLRQPELGLYARWRELVPSPAWALRYVKGEEFSLADDYLAASSKDEARVTKRKKKLAILAFVAAAVAAVLLAVALWQTNVATNALAEKQKLAEQAQKDKDDAEKARAESELERREKQKLAEQAQKDKDDAEKARAETKLEKENSLKLAEQASRDKAIAEEAKRTAKVAELSAEVANRSAQKSETNRVVALFESYLTGASLLAQKDDYAEARFALWGSTNGTLEKVVSRERLSTRDLLAWFVGLMGAGATQTNTEDRAPLRAIAASGDGRLLATVGEQGTAKMFNLVQNNPTNLLRQGEGAVTVTGVALDPKGRGAITADADPWVRCRPHPSAPRFTNQWRAPGPVAALAVSHNGEIVVVGGTNFPAQATLLDHTERFVVLPGGPTNITSLAFSPEDHLLAGTAADGTLCLWSIDPPNARGLRRVKPPKRLPKYSLGLLSVAFNPRGGEVATSSAGNTIQLWDLASETLKSVLQGHRNKVSSLAYTEKGDRLISASWDKSLRIWDLAHRTTLKVLQGHEAAVTGVSVAGDRIFSCSLDGTWRTWQMSEDSQQAQIIPFPSKRPSCCALSPDAQLLAVGMENGEIECLSLVNLRNNWPKAQARHTNIVTRLRFSPDGKQLASVGFDRVLNVWDVGTGTNLHQFREGLGEINDVAFFPDGRKLVTASSGGKSTLRSLSSLVEANEAGQIGIFELGKSEKSFQRTPTGEVLSVAFDHRGERLLSSGADGTTLLWNLQPTPAITRILSAKGDAATWTAFSPDSRLIATAYRGGTLEIATNSPSGYKSAARLPGHEEAIVRLAFSPYGEHILTASADRTLRAWDVQERRQLFVLRLPVPEEERTPLWDFAFVGKDRLRGEAWVAVPLTHGEVVIYRLGKVYP